MTPSRLTSAFLNRDSSIKYPDTSATYDAIYTASPMSISPFLFTSPIIKGGNVS
uniref:Uncharacterized protein n=1 Tax=viral metagenome TaxID=1070528 RepID=A0A6C0AWC2_9ZZZZ